MTPPDGVPPDSLPDEAAAAIRDAAAACAAALERIDRTEAPMTPRRAAAQWAPAFLGALRQTGVVLAACRAAQISRSAAYRRRARDGAFRAAWDDAINDALDLHELMVHRASLAGDAATSRWILSRRRPATWGDRVTVDHSDAAAAKREPLEVVFVRTGAAAADGDAVPV